MKKPTLKIVLCLITVILLTSGVLSDCQASKKGFIITLAETGAVVLTDVHIKTYVWATHTVELNARGIKQWNSFHTFDVVPKLDQSLYGKDFIASLNGKELYRGKFYSNVSSATYNGVVILDALFNLDSQHDTIRIDFGYPSTGFGAGLDPRNNQELHDFLQSKGLLK